MQLRNASLTNSGAQSGTTNCVVTVDTVTAATTTQDGSKSGNRRYSKAMKQPQTVLEWVY